MKKILTIGGRDIVFESNGVTPLLYKQAFKKDFFADLVKAGTVMQAFQDNMDNLSIENLDSLDKFDTEVIYRLLWACARTADKEIKPMFDWVVENPEISFVDDAAEIINLVVESMASKKKS